MFPKLNFDFDQFSAAILMCANCFNFAISTDNVLDLMLFDDDRLLKLLISINLIISIIFVHKNRYTTFLQHKSTTVIKR